MRAPWVILRSLTAGTRALALQPARRQIREARIAELGDELLVRQRVAGRGIVGEQEVNAGGGVQKLAEIEGGAQERRFTAGAQEISLRLAADLGDRVRLDHAARAIEQRSEGVTVHTARGSFSAQRAILALPPKMIASVDIADLPLDRIALHQRMQPGSVIKYIASYATPFWRDAGFSGEAFSTHGLVRATFDDSSASGDHAALVAFVVGDRAREFSKVPPEDRRRLLLSDLGRLHGPKAHHPTALVDKDWIADEYSGGCYVGVMPPRLLTEAAAGLRASHGLLHFAGTETAVQHVGYIEGAIESGERAAIEVGARLR